jgi:hypothetical protein
MKELIGVVPLFNRQTGAFEEARLYQPVDPSHLDDFDALWMPEFVRRFEAHVARGGRGTPEQLQDCRWEWRDLIEKYARRLDYESFALECAGSTQGLLLVATAAFGRAAGNTGLEIVYVDRLATAPWNRLGGARPPVYKGVGRILLIAALSLSDELGFHRRLGLHSLPQAESWYREVCGMEDLGPDPAYANLRYFEMTETQATAFVAEDEEGTA